VQILRVDQLVDAEGLGVVGEEVGRSRLDPGGDRVARPRCVVRGPVQPDRSDVHAGDRPAALGQPDRVGSFAAAHVERTARRQRGYLLDELRIGAPAPHALSPAVALVPELLGEHASHRHVVLRCGL
jgi:hypothetical protein